MSYSHRTQDVLTVVPDKDGDFVFVHEGAYVVRLKCPMDFNSFPFDNHVCFFEVRYFASVHVTHVATRPLQLSHTVLLYDLACS